MAYHTNTVFQGTNGSHFILTNDAFSMKDGMQYVQGKGMISVTCKVLTPEIIAALHQSNTQILTFDNVNSSPELDTKINALDWSSSGVTHFIWRDLENGSKNENCILKSAAKLASSMPLLTYLELDLKIEGELSYENLIELETILSSNKIETIAIHIWNCRVTNPEYNLLLEAIDAHGKLKRLQLLFSNGYSCLVRDQIPFDTTYVTSRILKSNPDMEMIILGYNRQEVSLTEIHCLIETIIDNHNLQCLDYHVDCIDTRMVLKCFDILKRFCTNNRTLIGFNSYDTTDAYDHIRRITSRNLVAIRNSRKVFFPEDEIVPEVMRVRRFSFSSQ